MSSEIPKSHTFSIASHINPHTIPEGKGPEEGKPFGEKYSGSFTVRRPNLADKQLIATKKAAVLSTHGYVNPELISQSLQLTIYIFAFMTTVSTTSLPDWFNPEKMYTETDEYAVFAVWEEVSRWLKESFPA